MNIEVIFKVTGVNFKVTYEVDISFGKPSGNPSGCGPGWLNVREQIDRCYQSTTMDVDGQEMMFPPTIMWRFPEIGGTPEKTSISRWEYTIQLLGYLHGYGNPHASYCNGETIFVGRILEDPGFEKAAFRGAGPHSRCVLNSMLKHSRIGRETWTILYIYTLYSSVFSIIL